MNLLKRDVHSRTSLYVNVAEDLHRFEITNQNLKDNGTKGYRMTWMLTLKKTSARERDI
jgi:hypothetical protein